MINENIFVKGVVSLKLIDENGVVKEEQEHNMILNAGLAYITSRMVGTSQNVMSHMAIGTGTTPTAKPQTALTTEIARVSLDSTNIVTTNVADDSVQYMATFAPGTGTGAITEALLTNASSAGTALARVVFDVVNKGALDTLAITWKTIIS